MSSGTPRLSGPGSPSFRRWARAGLTATGRGLGFSALAAAGAGLLLALAAPLFFLLFMTGRSGQRSATVAAMPQSASAAVSAAGKVISSQGAPGPSPGRPLIFAAVALLVLMAVWLFLLPRLVLAIRLLAQVTRRLVADWCGIGIAEPSLAPRAAGGGYLPRLRSLLGDPAAARELLWVVINACGGWVVAVLPASLIAVGLTGFLRAITHRSDEPSFLGHSPLMLIAASSGVIALGLAVAPWMLAAYGMLARSMLAPAGSAELVQRVRHLAETRSEAIDTGAAEMRRIERDLHDGAQARLVAMGMTLDAAGQLIDSNPAAARALLLEARDTSVKALAELRDLVRGIHPPVLADRGLGDAVRALALDSPLRARLASDLPGRLPAPVESAAYFAVSELLANVSKHAGATQTWIDIRYTDGMLRVGVSDNGRGGADPQRGTGLRGIERRVAAFDGVLAVHSPPAGPTAVTMEIPCALSSLKTSSC
ncbi:MAG TPA: histidine kinase [Streptosporangiaceae bacterium]|jgi:signal transduction histidine kinase